MIERPTQRWRRETAEQRAALAAGTISPEEAWAPELWPEDFTVAVDEALDAYEREVASFRHGSDDDQAWSAVECVVLALNHADDKGLIETGEREELREYIDQVLTNDGIDVEALTNRRGVDRAEVTDEWRDW